MPHNLNATIVGSFHGRSVKLARNFELISKNFRELLSPRSLDFTDPSAAFVRTAAEADLSVSDIESGVLAAVADSDFVWLHSDFGHVGTSATFEIGHAHALGVPVYCDVVPDDEMLCEFVTVVGSPLAVPDVLTPDPGAGLIGLQNYYRRISARRDWNGETPTEIIGFLSEEHGELARAVRKMRGARRDGGYAGVKDPGDEAADVALYLVHLMNKVDRDLASHVTAKESENDRRYRENAR